MMMPPANARSYLRVIAEIIRKEFYQVRQDKRMVAVSVVAPLLQIFVLGYAATVDVRNIDMVVCDQDLTSSSRQFVRAFTNSGYFVHAYQVSDPREVDRYIEHGIVRAALVIPQDFGRDILRRTTIRVQMVVDGTDANTASILIGYASQIAGQFAQNIAAESWTMTSGRRIARVLPEPRVWFNPDLVSSNYMVPGVVALVLMIITMTLTSLGIVREKEVGTLEQLLVTPIRPSQLILGKLIPFVIIGFVDVTLVLSVARFWFDVPMRGNILTLYGLSGLFILTTLGLGLFISTIARTQQQAMLIAQFFFFMPFMFLSGFAFPIMNMPGIVQYITYLIPLRYFLEIVRGVFLKGTGVAELYPQALALAAIGVTVLTLSVKRFRRTLE